MSAQPNTLDGLWRLMDSRAWDEQGNVRPKPYGANPTGTLLFSRGRMLAALCNGDHPLAADAPRGYSSYGGTYTFDGKTLVTTVDLSSDPTRIGGQQVRGVVVLDADRIILQPPVRKYERGGQVERRELLWVRVARGDVNVPVAGSW